MFVQTARRTACALIGVAMIGLLAHAEDPSIILGFPEFQNPVYTETPPLVGTKDPREVPGFSYGALTFFNGHAAAHNGATPVTNGSEYLVRSRIGAPFYTRTLVQPDFLLGQEMRPKPGKAPRVDLQNVTCDPPQKMFFVAHVQKFFASEPGFVTVDWGGTAGKEDLFISFEAVHTPMAIYHTDQYPDPASGLNGTPTKAPVVNLNLPNVEVTIHHNSIIPADTPGPDNIPNNTDDVRFLWKFSNPKELHAARVTGLVVLEYNRTVNPGPSDFLGVQVVEVRPYFPDNSDLDAATFIGEELTPTRTIEDKYINTALPFVAKGDIAEQGDSRGAFVYQHRMTGATRNGDVFAIRETEADADIEVFWKRRAIRDTDFDGLHDDVDNSGIEWPYEMGRFTATWPENNPERYQVYVRGAIANPAEPDPGPGVAIASTLNPELMPYHTSGPDKEELPILSKPTAGGPFRVGAVTGSNNWALLKYRPGNDVAFQVVRCVAHDDATEPGFELALVDKPIGAEIKDPDHQAEVPGYIHIAQQSSLPIREDRYDWAVYDGVSGGSATSTIDNPTGQIIPVNTGNLEVWWYNTGTQGVEWPSKVSRYRSVWPADAEPLVISRQDGVALPTLDTTAIYFQNTPAARGYNPNDEHAFVGEDKDGPRIYTLRDDLGLSPGSGEVSNTKSAPYLLLRYEQAPNSWRHVVRKVMATDAQHPFSDWSEAVSDPVTDPYEVQMAGFQDGKLAPQGPINAPIPLQQLSNWEKENRFVGYPCDPVEGGCPPIFLARDDRYYPLGAGLDGTSTEEITAKFYYKINANHGFYFPPDYKDRAGVPINPAADAVVPWLNLANGATGNEPIDVRLSIYWPEDPGELQVGDTLFEARNGLPAVEGQCSTEVIYQQSVVLNGDEFESVALIDPFSERTAPLDIGDFPFDEIRVEQLGNTYALSDLSPSLARRIRYDAAAQVLRLTGALEDPVQGDAYLLLNVLTERDLYELLHLGPEGAAVQSAAYQVAVSDLYEASNQVDRILRNEDGTVETPDTGVAITAGFAQEPGFVTVIFGNNQDCAPGGPVGVYTFRVTETPWRGRVVPIEPDCVFQEKLTLQHVGDFGGTADEYEFQWFTSQPLRFGKPPLPVVDGDGNITSLGTWTELQNLDELKVLADEVEERVGANAITIKEGRLILTDNLYACRYRYRGDNQVAWRGKWSEITEPALGEGWIKRVLAGVGPYAPRDNGQPSGLTQAEAAFASYGDEINSIVNQISQAGKRWEGDTPLNCASVDDHGLIEIYETVLNRGISLSLNANPPYADDDLNQALLLVASRISDLYTLLGNEAYADASDPTIGFGTSNGQFGSTASSIFCFQGQNQVAGLIDEELALLRGVHRDNGLRNVQLGPVYNRLLWNFTRDIVGGEVAYALNYDIRDASGNLDGKINEADAARLYPQGHGDAWGHYLTSLSPYYRLLRNENYAWKSRSEFINIGGAPIEVDYRDEEKFAANAAAKARTGAEIVNLTYRKNYVEDPEAQYQGYRDTDKERAWGLADWGSRAGQGAYLDWVVANAILPAESDETGLRKIDRTTIPELREITARFEEIQSQVDMADRGLNPLGIARNAVPFDIAPAANLSEFKPHFEQIYERAVSAMNTAIAAFNFAQESTQNLRRQAEEEAQFNNNIDDQEADFRGRLIEIFGTPYPDDPAYPSGYDGPDVFNYFLVDATELLGEVPGATEAFTVNYRDLEVNSDGTMNEMGTKDVTYQLNTSGLIRLPKPAEWTRRRQAPGEIQFALSDLFQSIGRFQGAMLQYNELLQQIEEAAAQLQAQENLNAAEITILTNGLTDQQSLNDAIARSRARQLDFRTKGRMAVLVADALAEFLPKSVGLSNDVTAPGRGAIRLAGTVISEVMNQNADQESLAELDHQQAQSIAQAQQNIELTALRSSFAIKQQLLQLEQTIRREAQLRLEIYGAEEAMQQTIGRYMAAVARGTRLLEDRLRFARRTTGEINQARYKDMAFRIFRNDALQKYRAQYDLAATYVYLAAKAYDYETNLLGTDSRSGQLFLNNIVRSRTIGEIGSNGQPRKGSGLANAMATMNETWGVVKSRLRFDNPQQQDLRISLRSEFFRILPGEAGQQTWKETLRRHVVPNLNDLPEYQQFAVQLFGAQTNEPAIVIPFSTTVALAHNFFGWPLASGDTSLGASTNFANKVRSVGVWFGGYNDNTAGLSTTPFVYLLPVGEDIMRSPTNGNKIRSWNVVDQIIPTPSEIDGVLGEPGYIPRLSLSEAFGDIRKIGSFRAYHDSGFNINQAVRDSRLVGRSVWNTEWLLIIPAAGLLNDRDEAIDRFIDGDQGVGVTDIQLLFDTYGYSAQ
jgi:hypothetical protein